jgi:hypothetical protein
MSWEIYIKHTTSEVVQPFMLLVPPALAHVNTNTTTGASGTGVMSKQIVIPLAGDSNLTTLQISRIKAIPTPANPTTDNGVYNTTCNPNLGSGSNNSAMCLGMVFYSITFYRI